MIYLVVGVALLCAVFAYLVHIMVSDMGWKKTIECLVFAIGLTSIVALASVLISRGIGSL